MRLKDLSNEEILKRILASDKLRERFDAAVQESEMNYIDEILHSFNNRCADWSIGPYNRNYFKCTEPSEFVYCARQMVDSYGASDKTMKVLSHCEKLRGSNLFEHYANKLADCIEADLCEMCDGIEDICYDIYCQNVTPILLDMCEWFADSRLDDVMLDEDTEEVYRIERL